MKYRNEKEIDLLDLLYHILCKWKWLLISALIGCVFMSVLGYFRVSKEAEIAKAKLEEQQNMVVEEGQVIEEIIVPEVKIVSGKYVSLGIVLGLLVTYGWVACKYVTSPRLHRSKDIKEQFHVGVLENLVVTQHKKGSFEEKLFHKFVDDRINYSNEERMQMILMEIEIMMKKQNMKSVYITGSTNDEDVNKTIVELSECLREKVEVVQSGNSVVVDSKSLENLSLAEGVVLVEKVDVSCYSDIERELELCKNYQIPVIGSIVLL